MADDAEIQKKNQSGGYRDPHLLVEQVPMEVSNDVPVYVTIRDALAAEIRSGAQSPQSRLPSERYLALKHNVARMTARKALSLLEAEGKIYRADRRGYFVAPARIKYDPSSPMNLMRQLRSQGYLTENVYLGRSLLDANARLAEAFRVEIGEPLALERCVVKVEDRAIVYSEDYLLLDAFPGYADKPFVSPMMQNLDRNYGVQTRTSTFSIRAAPLSLVAAQHLGASSDHPGISIAFIREAEGRPVVTDRCFWRSDVVDLVFGQR